MTNKIALRDIEQFMQDYRPSYVPMMPLLLGRNAQQYQAEAGKVDFKRAEAMGDIRSRRLGPKDTEMHQIASREGTKTFLKYFFGSQYVQSQLQDRQGYEDVVAQVLDEHNKQADELVLGDRDASDAIINNGIFYSNDANYTTKTGVSGSDLKALYAKVMGIFQEADDVAGEKMIMFYGPNTVEQHNALFSTTDTPFVSALREATGASIQKMPTSVTPASSEGFLVINLDQIKTHYVTLPQIKNQGINEEKMYAWTNFLMGSVMIEVLAKDGIIKQPLTYS